MTSGAPPPRFALTSLNREECLMPRQIQAAPEGRACCTCGRALARAKIRSEAGGVTCNRSVPLRHLLVLSVAALLMCNPAVAQQTGSGIGYPSVAAALSAVRNKAGVSVSVQGGWTIISDSTSATLWSFTPLGHPADPSAVRRRIVQKGGSIFVEMAIACEAQKSACDKLVAEFNQLNERMRQGR
jgi:hypothetical protein